MSVSPTQKGQLEEKLRHLNNELENLKESKLLDTKDRSLTDKATDEAIKKKEAEIEAIEAIEAIDEIDEIDDKDNKPW